MAALEHAESARLVAERARRRGAWPHLMDGRSITDRAGVLAAIAEALSFPSYFGRNLDALHDCLMDLSWLPAGDHVLIWAWPDILRAADPAAYAGVCATLSDAVRHRRDIERTVRVVLTDE